MTQSKLEIAVEQVATALEADAPGRVIFKDILAMTIQDQIEKRDSDENGFISLNTGDIYEIAQDAAEDFMLTLENQNDED